MTWVHINRVRHSEYFAFARKHGHRKWECYWHGKRREVAFRKAAEALASGEFKRVTVTGWQEWYGHDEIARMVKA